MAMAIVSRRAMLLLALLGGAAGAINAWLCLVQLPVPIKGIDFRWVIVPGGAVHGAVLAIVPVWVGLVVSNCRSVLRILLAAPIGWMAGYLSWIPLDRWAIGESWRNSLLWLSRLDSGPGVIWAPFAYFGLVSALLFLLRIRVGAVGGVVRQVSCATVAGVMGSLWFWIDSEPWYFAPIHGTIWGVLVGLGLARLAKTHAVAEQGDEADEAFGGTRAR
jgi:hypothetical protein